MSSQIMREETRSHNFMGYCFQLSARVLLYGTDTIAHTTNFVIPVVEHWLDEILGVKKVPDA